MNCVQVPLTVSGWGISYVFVSFELVLEKEKIIPQITSINFRLTIQVKALSSGTTNQFKINGKRRFQMTQQRLFLVI